MLPEDRDAAYLWDMLSAAREVRDMLHDISLEKFQTERIVMRATERCIEIIGEAARRVSSTTRQAQTDIPWSDLVGQRNILAHEYGQIDHELLYRTATEDVPALIALLEKRLPTN
ncbi:MAG TPA: HepT-like ribonuclease domain-containing protein [Steroidobacteraceae bacterium]|nr:HepT-like ribonuclease domain-containing protein [Steroidobacteraceae bacterium]